MASDVEEGVEERQATDPFLTDWDDNDPDNLPFCRSSQQVYDYLTVLLTGFFGHIVPFSELSVQGSAS